MNNTQALIAAAQDAITGLTEQLSAQDREVEKAQREVEATTVQLRALTGCRNRLRVEAIELLDRMLSAADSQGEEGCVARKKVQDAGSEIEAEVWAWGLKMRRARKKREGMMNAHAVEVKKAARIREALAGQRAQLEALKALKD